MFSLHTAWGRVQLLFCTLSFADGFGQVMQDPNITQILDVPDKYEK